MPSARSVICAAVVSALGVMLCACAPQAATTHQLLLAAGGWFTGIQERNFAQLARFDADAPAAAESREFAAWQADVTATLDRYVAQKLQGRWEVDPKGYALVLATLVGSFPGTVWGAPAREGSAEAPVLIVQPNFAYDHVGRQGYAPGAIIFVQGYPVGVVHRLEIGGTTRREVDLLDSLRLRIHFRRLPQGKGWTYKVVKAELIEESVRHRVVTWVF